MTINIKSKAVIPFISLLLITASCGDKDISLGRPHNSGPLLNGFEGSDYGYAVWDPENSTIVMGHNIDSGFIPASVTKLFTALFSHDVLGKNYSFETQILYTGKISDGAINGDLYIKGSGDPELSVYELFRLASALKEKKINSITGHFYYDESALPEKESLDYNMPFYAPYNSGIGALNLNRNTVQLIRRNKDGSDSFTYEFLPAAESIKAVKYERKPEFPFVNYNYSDGKEIWDVPSKKILFSRHHLPVKKTGLFTAWTFYNLCAVNGILLKNPEAGTAPGSSKKLCSHTGRPLHRIIPDMLKYSDNLTAEILGSATLAKYSNDKNRQMNFEEASAYYFNNRFSKIGLNGFNLANGSGLTSSSRLTPGQVIAVLIALSNEYRLEDILPMSGESGTLKSRLDSPLTAYRVFAKTGSINYASSLAGLLYTDSGKKYLFAVFINDTETRETLDNKKIKDKNDSNLADRWSKKATETIDGFIYDTIRQL